MLQSNDLAFISSCIYGDRKCYWLLLTLPVNCLKSSREHKAEIQWYLWVLLTDFGETGTGRNLQNTFVLTDPQKILCYTLPYFCSTEIPFFFALPKNNLIINACIAVTQTNPKQCRQTGDAQRLQPPPEIAVHIKLDQRYTHILNKPPFHTAIYTQLVQMYSSLLCMTACLLVCF